MKGLHQRVGVCILTIEWLINLLVLRAIDTAICVQAQTANIFARLFTFET
jgi:hypothetical protein